MTELLPCPFCGDQKHLSIKRTTTDSDWVQAGCMVCCAQGPYCQTHQQAADGWNTRYVAGAKNLSSDSFASINDPKPKD